MAYYGKKTGKHQNELVEMGMPNLPSPESSGKPPSAFGPSCPLAATLTHRPGLGTQVGFKVIII